MFAILLNLFFIRNVWVTMLSCRNAEGGHGQKRLGTPALCVTRYVVSLSPVLGATRYVECGLPFFTAIMMQ